MTTLAPCPCGEVPTQLFVSGSDSDEEGFVCGSCCNKWNVLFFLGAGEKFYSGKSLKLAAEAWNAAPRKRSEP